MGIPRSINMGLLRARMNRNPAKPKVIMAPCTCAKDYVECNCAWLRSRSLGAKPPPFKITNGMATVMILVCFVVGVGLSYLFGG